MRNPSLEFCRVVSEELDPGKLLHKFLNALLQLQKLERGSIWVKRDDGYCCLEAVGHQSERVKGMTLPLDRPSIVGWVIENAAMTIAEPGKDKRHFQEVERGLRIKSRLILCFPLFLKTGAVYGAVELIDISSKGDRLNLDPHFLDSLQQLIDLGAIAISNALTYHDQVRENDRLRKTLETIRSEEVIIGRSPALVRVLKCAETYAKTDFPVLITGESGTGKELLARSIHRMSPRREKPMLTQNCSAIPESLLESELFGYAKGAFTGAIRDQEGLFEAADGGTLFLDEIGDMPLHLQARMLRVLQDGEVKPVGATKARRVNVRVISATNKDLKDAIQQGFFREDLFYRLSVLPLHVPSLRERPQDIPLLLKHFFDRESRRLGIPAKRVSGETMKILLSHPWKGNIRELENFVKQMSVVVSGPVIEPENLALYFHSGMDQPRDAAAKGLSHGAANPGEKPPMSSSPAFAGFSWSELETAYVHYLLDKHKWRVSHAAREAGVNRTTFAARMRKLGIRRS